ncbi:hypothetical protein CALCODRAFT_497772 [Calocera cornea HHB12733]|uniref:Uncharacterized protein n=1 Tax=Calocera cornea HHB12733 TaxID=1353952 RepID=A0A165F329_9BASI|nr:hypothetical protein CALCODRAFT_497772 [Calocera cornea HHB12733]
MLTVEEMRMVGFEEHESMLALHRPLMFDMCCKSMNAKLDIVLEHKPSMISCIIIQDKYAEPSMSAMPQAVAYACAVFQYNNAQRLRHGKLPLKEATIPFATMRGLKPAFYTMTVTADLNEALMAGTILEHETKIRRCLTNWQEGSRDFREESPARAFRRKVFKNMDAFRLLAIDLRAPWEL